MQQVRTRCLALQRCAPRIADPKAFARPLLPHSRHLARMPLVLRELARPVAVARPSQEAAPQAPAAEEAVLGGEGDAAPAAPTTWKGPFKDLGVDDRILVCSCVGAHAAWAGYPLPPGTRPGACCEPAINQQLHGQLIGLPITHPHPT